MRKPGGMKAIDDAIERLSKTHAEHISQYGTGNELRLTGKHEVTLLAQGCMHGIFNCLCM